MGRGADQSRAERRGAVEFTIGADGKSLTGRWTYDGSQTSWHTNWTGRCSAGGCLKNVGTRTTPTTTATTPTSKTVELAISWSMPKRYGIVGRDGLLNSLKTPREISPPSFRVDLIVRPKGSRPCRESDAIAWVAKGALRDERTTGCRFAAIFPKEGTFTLKASLKGKDGVAGSGEVDVRVQDWLIFGLGDSNGSGEGAPDIPSPPLPAIDAPVWQDVQCDRSAYSFEAQTARSIENADPKTSVTFAHLACSGATIQQGLLGAYGGINAGATLAPQLLEMKRLAGKREIDAVLISIGVNDLGFGAMVEHCILYTACQSRGFPELKSARTLDQVMAARINELPKLYDHLSHSLKAIGVPAPNVYLSEYFDSTRDQTGSFCDPLIRVDARGLRPYTVLIGDPFLKILAAAATSVVLDFDRAEAKWAYENVLVKLNEQVKAAASKHGWGFVGGVADKFREHGYCSRDSWITGMYESFERQHDHNGTLHANARGNGKTATLAVKQLREDLYPNGLNGPPRAPK